MIESTKKRGIDLSLIQKVRDRIVDIAQDNDGVEDSDISRLKRDDTLIVCFILQHFPEHEDRNEKTESEGIDRVCKHLLETLKWRKDQGVNHIKLSDFPSECVSWNFSMISKETVNDNTKVIVCRSNKFEKSMFEIGDFAARFWIYLLDGYISNLFSEGFEITVIYDLRGFKYSNFDFGLTLQVLSLTQRYFPFLIKHTYAFEPPFVIRPFMKLTLSALGNSFLRGFEVLDFKSAVSIFGGFNYVPKLLGGNNPMAVLVDAPVKVVTVRDLAANKGLKEEQIQALEKLVSESTQKLKVDEDMFV
jgi:hypothetical protein